MTQRTVFFPSTHPWLAAIIRLDTPAAARRSAEKLTEEFNKSNKSRRLLILRAVNLAAIRARIGARKPNYSEKEHREFREIYRIYRNLYRRLSRKYKAKYGER